MSDWAPGTETRFVRTTPHLPGHIIETKGPLRETVIRDFLKKFGQPEHQVDEMLRAARASQKARLGSACSPTSGFPVPSAQPGDESRPAHPVAGSVARRSIYEPRVRSVSLRRRTPPESTRHCLGERQLFWMLGFFGTILTAVMGRPLICLGFFGVLKVTFESWARISRVLGWRSLKDRAAAARSPRSRGTATSPRRKYQQRDRFMKNALASCGMAMSLLALCPDRAPCRANDLI